MKIIIRLILSSLTEGTLNMPSVQLIMLLITQWLKRRAEELGKSKKSAVFVILLFFSLTFGISILVIIC